MAVAYFLHHSTCAHPLAGKPTLSTTKATTPTLLSLKPFSVLQNPKTRTLRLRKTSSLKRVQRLASTTSPILLETKPPLDLRPYFSTTTNNNEPPPPATTAFSTSLVETLKKGATAFVIVLAVVISTPPFAMALTGGRMGGRRSSSSSSHHHRSSSSCNSRSALSYEEDIEEGWKFPLRIILAVGVMVVFATIDELEKNPVSESCYTAVKLQVGTRSVTKYLQEALNEIAETADTSTPTGWAYILRESTKTLCKKLDRCISAYSYVKEEDVHRVAMHLYHDFSKFERLKFDEETLVKTNGEENSLQGRFKSRATDEELASEYAVVIFVLVARGAYKLPAVRSSKDLEKALKILQSIPATKIEALEVLWAPQQHNDVLREKELHEKYPTLTPL